jgi:hypothetical protein
MPAFESRRVRTQPLTVTGASCGALPAKILRTLNTLSSIERELSWSSVKSQLNGGNPDQAIAVRKLPGATMARVSSSMARNALGFNSVNRAESIDFPASCFRRA